MIKILIAGYHGFGNCGDEATLLAMTQNIKKHSDVEITAFSYKPEFTKKEYNINSVQRFSFLDVFSAIKNNDIVISGGGTLLQDGTSTRSLMYYLAIIKLAKMLGKKVMLYANGIGPVEGKFNRKMINKIVNKVDVITLREKLSESDLLSIGVNKPKTVVTADPAFTLKPVEKDRVIEIFENENIPLDKEIVGVCIRDWQKAKFGEDDFVNEIAKLCDNLVKEGKNVVLLPMQYPRDLDISQRLVDKMSQKAYILKNPYRPSEILGIIGNFNLVISMRLHSLIFAAVMDVPMLGIIYDPKVEYYLRLLNMPVAGDVRYDKLNNGEILDKCNNVFDNYDEVKKDLKNKTEMLIKKANINDEILFGLIDDIRRQKNEK